ncbi:ribosomal RNA processing protein 36 homolog isoform X2 [Ptiloglossa arizonensis]
MSFEDLQKLKEKLGTKIYNETLFGPRKVKKLDFKRENKNRPREMSAKKPISRFKQVIQAKKNIPRDPRFDTLCGTFNQKEFKKAYGFVTDMKKNDLQKLKEQLNETEDPKMIKKIKYLIQRLENQLREEKRRGEQQEKKTQDKQGIVEAIKRGEKPLFKKKTERRILDLVSQYEELKNSGKLKKHIQRLRKKNLHKDRQKLASSEVE